MLAFYLTTIWRVLLLVPGCHPWMRIKSLSNSGSFWARRQTSTRCTSKSDPTNLHQVEGWWAAFTGVETRLWSTVDHLDPTDLPRHGCNSDWGHAASGGPTVLANDHNSGRLRLNASRHDDDDDCVGHSNYRPTGNRQAQHVPCGISYNSRLISVLAIVKFKLVLVIKIQHWVPIVIMYFLVLLWHIISFVPKAEINANHALITSLTFMFLIAIVLNSS